jgi:Ni/Co efflux regulator RcnB
MRRLILTLTTAAAMAASLAAPAALADQGRGRGHGGWEQGRDRRGDRQGPPRGYPGMQLRGSAPEARPYYAPPPSYGLRRGGYLPPDFRSGMLNNYGRYRLRPPPPGYAWFQVGDEFLLVSLTNGLIFDVVRP